jgi:hypothetical protein
MNTGNSVQDADERCAVTAQDADLPTLEQLPIPEKQDEEAEVATVPRDVPRNVQELQELIDKLAAVNKQLRYPGHS